MKSVRVKERKEDGDEEESCVQPALANRGQTERRTG